MADFEKERLIINIFDEGVLIEKIMEMFDISEEQLYKILLDNYRIYLFNYNNEDIFLVPFDERNIKVVKRFKGVDFKDFNFFDYAHIISKLDKLNQGCLYACLNKMMNNFESTKIDEYKESFKFICFIRIKGENKGVLLIDDLKNGLNFSFFQSEKDTNKFSKDFMLCVVSYITGVLEGLSGYAVDFAKEYEKYNDYGNWYYGYKEDIQRFYCYSLYEIIVFDHENASESEKEEYYSHQRDLVNYLYEIYDIETISEKVDLSIKEIKKILAED
jgi:hypothetical protein